MKQSFNSRVLTMAETAQSNMAAERTISPLYNLIIHLSIIVV